MNQVTGLIHWTTSPESGSLKSAIEVSENRMKAVIISQTRGLSLRSLYPQFLQMLHHSTGYKLAHDGADKRSLAHFLDTAICSQRFDIRRFARIGSRSSG